MSQGDNDKQQPCRPHRQFEDDVLPAELSALKNRSSAATRREDNQNGLPDFRNANAGDDSSSAFFDHTLELLDDDTQNLRWQKFADANPGKKHGGLTGLALSGGGIRSASVNLGITQVLHRIGLFKCFDYLSTVSGGGYLGSSISSCYTAEPPPKGEPEAKPEETTAEKLQRAETDFPFQHVAGKPEGVAFRQVRDFSKFLVPRGFVDYVRLPVLLIRGVLINFLVILPWILGAALFTRLLLLDDGSWRWTAYTPIFTGSDFALTLLLSLVFLLLALLFPVGRLGQYFISGFTDLRLYRNRYEGFMAITLSLIAVVAWIEFQRIAFSLFGAGQHLGLGELTAYIGTAGAVLASMGNLLAKNLSKLLNRFGLYIIALIGFLAFWLLYLLLVTWLMAPEPPPWWPEIFGSSIVMALSVLLIILFVYTNVFVDANALSLHNFYRDRLSAAFVFCVNKEDDSINTSIDPKLTDLAESGVGPLHLINTTLNTSEFPEQFRRGRHGEPFLLSPVYCGSRITGYCKTDTLEDEQPDLRLSTAVATSAAAVSSNMGTQTTAVLRLILSVLNIRLGYWLRNPMVFASGGDALWLRLGLAFRVGVFRYLQELTGFVSYKTSYVYLSDGGHMENLGIYELVRRQCRLIVVGDGECDKHYTFKGLTDALRLVRVDFGVTIEMDGLDEIRSGEQQYARGTIEYPDGRVGYLIYLKSSLLGDDMVEATVSEDAYVSSPLRRDVRLFDELGYVAHYKATYPDFPQESTGDQFFDEVQLESYRALGYLIAKRAFVGEDER